MEASTPRQNLMTVTAYAESRKARGLPGGSRVAVYKAIQAGRIKLDLSGKIDQILADYQWEQRTRMAMPPCR